MKSGKRILLFCLFCFLLSACHEKSGPETPEKLFEQYRKAVVLIRNEYYLKVNLGNNKSGYLCESEAGDEYNFTMDEAEAKRHPLSCHGTGFFISEDGKIATNRHVVFPVQGAKEILSSMSWRIKSILEEGAGVSVYNDSIAEINDYIESHAEDISEDEIQALSNRKEKLEEKIVDLTGGHEVADFDAENLNVSAVPFEVSIAYDNTYVNNDESYHPCRVLCKSDNEPIDLAIIQLKDNTTPSNVERIFSFEDQNPNIKNGTADKGEEYDINKQLTIDKKLYMIGFNYGEEMANTTNGLKVQFTQGSVSQESDDYKVMYTIPSLPGSSGSPVIDQWGNLVAINYAGVTNSQSFNYGILAKHLKNLSMNERSDNKTNNHSEENVTAGTHSNIDFEEKIREFVDYEAERDFEAIYNSFSSNMRRYWDLTNPTKAQLKSRYEHSWKVSSDSRNEIKEIKKVDAFTYDLHAVYKYTNKKGDPVTINTVVRYEFDAYGKIVETYGR